MSQYSQENTFVGVFFNKIAGFQACNFIKKRLQNRCFPVNIAKFFKSTYFEEHRSVILKEKVSLISTFKK